MTRTAAGLIVAAAFVAAGLGCWRALDSGPTQTPSSVAADAAPHLRARLPRRRKQDADAPPRDATETNPAATRHEAAARLVVRVTADPGGSPIAGADVLIADADDREQSATTDASGAARFEKLVAGFARVLVEAPGRVRFVDMPVPVGPEEPGECDVELRAGVAASGVVLDEDGRPIAGASAMATEHRDDWMDDSVTPYAETKCAADGTFRLATLPADAACFLQFAAPDRAVLTIEWDPAAGRRVEARLVRAGDIRGTVRLPSGRAAAGAVVKATSADGAARILDAECDAQGRYAFERLAAGGKWSLVASASGTIDSAPVEARAAGADASACDLRLRRLPRIEFIVTDPSGAPVEDAEIDVKDRSGVPSIARTAHGRATFEIAEPGPCRATIDAPGAAPREESVDAVADEKTTVAVRLDAGAFLEGVVVDDVGAAVAGASLAVEGTLPAGFGGWERATTSRADGTFRLEGLIPAEYRLDATADLYVSWNARVAEPTGGLRVVLPRFGRIVVRLRAPKDATPGDVHATFDPLPSKGIDFDRGEIALPESPAAWTGSRWTESVGVSAGRWRVTVATPGFVDETHDLVVTRGATTELPEIVLDRGLTIEGVVVNDLGRPVAGASVSAEESDDSMKIAKEVPYCSGWTKAQTTDADGAFRIAAVPRSVRSARVSASVADGDSQRLDDVAVPTASLRVVLRRNGTVTFRVRAPDGQSDVAFEYEAGGRNWVQATTGADVRLKLPPDERTIDVRAPGFAPTQFDVNVVPGEDVRPPDVVLDVGATVTGRVVDAAGRPVAAAELRFNGVATKTGDDGRFVVEHVERGDPNLEAKASGFLDLWLGQIPATTTPLVVVMKHGVMIRGRIHDAAGTPVANARFDFTNAESPDRPWTDMYSTADGTFTARLPEGRWKVVVTIGDTQAAEREVEFVEGGEATLDIAVNR